MDWIKNTLATLQIAIGLLPVIIDAVKAVEMPGWGPEKLALVVTTVKEGFNVLPQDVLTKIGADKLEGFVSKVVGYVVSFLNKVGAFKNS